MQRLPRLLASFISMQRLPRLNAAPPSSLFCLSSRSPALCCSSCSRRQREPGRTVQVPGGERGKGKGGKGKGERGKGNRFARGTTDLERERIRRKKNRWAPRCR
eukprot:1826481-Rhodomonas_salina.1